MSYDVNKIIELALEEVGYCEKATNSNLYSKTGNAGYNNYTKYAYEIDTQYPNFYNGAKNGFAYCDIFYDWLHIKCFGEEGAKYTLCQPSKSCGAGCDFSAGYYKSAGRFYKSNPKVGDQIFFCSGSSITHTGLVYKVDSSKVYTIEGNTSGASGVVANGGGVAKKSYSLSYSKIYGYGRPRYDTEYTGGVDTSTSSSSSSSNYATKIKEFQTWLNKNYSANLDKDGDYGPLTKKAAIKAWQTEINKQYGNKLDKALELDGVFGELSKEAAKLCKVAYGAKGNITRIVQGMLYCYGFNPNGFDGSFGNGCRSAVKSFQKSKGLDDDGVVGQATFTAMFS